MQNPSVPADGRPADETSGAAQAASEIDEYLRLRDDRRRLLPRAALTGALAGLLAVAFRAALAGADALRNGLIAYGHRWPAFGWLLPVVFGAVCAALSVWMVRRVAPEAAGSGIPHLEAALHRFREMKWRRVLPVKFAGGLLALGSGMALGREGPTVQMGGAVGAAVADGLKSPTRERLTLMAAGAGAGLAAAFNAPLSGLVFVLEEVQKDFRQAVFGAAFVAAAVANIMARSASGQLPVFTVPSYAVPSLNALPIFAVLGLLCGLLGVAFNRGLIGSLNLAAKIPPRFKVIAAGGVGAVAGLTAWYLPLAAGAGHGLTNEVLAGRMALSVIPLWFAGRFVFTLASYSTGAPGGIFAPLLALGALIGLAVGQTAHHFAPHVAPIAEVFAVVGMAAYFTAIVRAPLTGIVLILEMTGDYAQMLPLLTACFCAYTVAEGLGDLPIYERLLARDLRQSGDHPPASEPIAVEREVQPGSSFAGKTVRELGLPTGVILIRCREGNREWIPNADTRIEPGIRLTALIAPEATDGLNALWHGCEAGH